jgi:hypothetical protein
MPNHILRQYLSNVGVFPGKTSRRFDMLKLIEGLKVVPIHEELLRVGPDRDGGYLVPDVLDGIDYCFSPGVADCSEFELQLAKRGIKVFMADKSVQSPSDVHENFNFIEFYISSINSPVEQLITLDAWYEQKLNTIPSATSPEAILQMDVEGDEYQVLHSISNVLLSRFRVIIIEFHKLYQLADRFSFSLMAPAIEKLLKSHSVVHIHPNNNRKSIKIFGLKIPATLEITFLRNDFLTKSKKKLNFPHPLDQKSVPSKRDLILPKCWY